MIRIDPNINLTWNIPRHEKEARIKEANEILSRYGDIFNWDVTITGTIGAQQLRGILNVSGATRKILSDVKSKTDVFAPVGDFKMSGSGKYQHEHKDKTLRRLGKRYSNVSIGSFQKLLKRLYRTINDKGTRWNILWYGDIV